MGGQRRKQHRRRLAALAATASLVAIGRAGFATTFTDTTGDNYGPAYVDISSVAVTNDASNLTFQINLDPSANVTSSDGSQIYGKYQIGIQTAPGGSTATMNPYGNPIGISGGGMNYWFGGWADTSPTPPFSGYGQLFHWNGAGWDVIAGYASNPFVDTPTTLAATSITFSLPLSSLGLNAGANVQFDVWTTFGTPGGQSAYDALNNPSQTFDPNGTARPWLGSPYDSGTLLSSYTVAGVGPTNASWSVDADGNWSQASNWTPNAPNAAGAVANFGPVITAPRTVTVDAAQTTAQVNFNSAVKYTIAGTSTLTLDNTAGGVDVNVANGSHDVTAPLLLARDATISVTPAASTLTLSDLRPSTVGVTKAGAGALAVNNVRAGSLTINAGTVAVIAGRGPNGTSKVGSLTVGAGAALNLADQDLIVDYSGASPLGSIRSLIAGGYNAGSWNGTGIQSSAAAVGNAGRETALGYAEAASVGFAGGGTFSGQSVDNTAVLVRYTLTGDADLSGNVDLTDFTFLAAHFNQTSGANWLDGDFDYSGGVDLTDFTFLAGNFNQSMPAGAATSLGAAVPEPASIAAALIGLLAVRRRRVADTKE